MRNVILSACVLASLVSGSGCVSSRTIGGMNQSGEKNITLVETEDIYSVAYIFPFKSVHQFWKCSEAPGTMTCKKVCDVKGSDLTCPFVPVGGTGAVNTVK
jgi:hypothetical protein